MVHRVTPPRRSGPSVLSTKMNTGLPSFLSLPTTHERVPWSLTSRKNFSKFALPATRLPCSACALNTLWMSYTLPLSTSPSAAPTSCWAWALSRLATALFAASCARHFPEKQVGARHDHVATTHKHIQPSDTSSCNSVDMGICLDACMHVRHAKTNVQRVHACTPATVPTVTWRARTRRRVSSTLRASSCTVDRGVNMCASGRSHVK